MTEKETVEIDAFEILEERVALLEDKMEELINRFEDLLGCLKDASRG